MSTTTQTSIKNSIIVVKTNLPVLGMSCAACAGSVESVLRSLPGIANAEVHFAAQTVQIAFDAQVITLPEMQKAVQSFGYDLIVQIENAAEPKFTPHIQDQEGVEFQEVDTTNPDIILTVKGDISPEEVEALVKEAEFVVREVIAT